MDSALGMALAVAAVGGCVCLWFLKSYVLDHKRKPSPPEVPGLPLIGNLLQVKTNEPYKMFTKWAQTYGPIYSITTGYKTMLVLNSNDVVKEALVTRFSAISNKKLSNSLKILTSDKDMVSASDYNDFHKTAQRHLLTNILGPNAQKRNRVLRDNFMGSTSNHLHSLSKIYPPQAVNLGEIFAFRFFGLAMKLTFGEDVDSIYVDELGATMSKHDLINCLVNDPLAGAFEVDWREFFPYLRWLPNRSFDNKIGQMHFRKMAVMKALVQQAKKRISSNEGMQCYLDYLLSEGKTLSEKQIQMLLWEVIVVASDTTSAATLWAMYELAKDSKRQDRLYEEISRVCGSERITEEKLPQLPYLYAVSQETLRAHTLVPIVPLRYVHEDTTLGGYYVPSGSEIAINIYGCNMDKNVWKNPEEWNPERFIDENCSTSSMDFYKTMAFGGGKRVCPGALQAMTISRMTIGRLIQEFEWRLKDGQIDDADTLGLRRLHQMLAFIKPRS